MKGHDKMHTEDAEYGPEDAGQEPDTDKAKRMAQIEAMASVIKGKRTEAISARRASGIEAIWTEDEEHYEGIDGANRATAKVLKGRNMTDGLREERRDQSGTRSTVFLKITRPYVDAAAARVSDMLLPTDDRNFAVKPGKVPELTSLQQDIQQQPAAQPMQPAQQPPQQRNFMSRVASMFGMGQGAPEPAPQQDAAVLARQTIDKAKKAAERAQQEIDDWLTECRYHAEVRKVIECAAKVGTGILKGPQPSLTRRRAAAQSPDGQWRVDMQEKLSPQSRWINHWNFYPAADCGDDIQKGSCVFECDDITARALMDLKKTPGYIPEMIEMCIEEGPVSPTDGTRRLKEGETCKDGDLFQIWYYHGQLGREEMEAAGCKCPEGEGEQQEFYPCCVTMVNDRVIKVTMSHLDSGEFPYDVMVWQASPDHWAGVGVARQMRECQKGANAAVRNLMDNAALSAGPQIIVDRNKLIPADGNYRLTPRKVWYTAQDGDIEDVRKAFTIVNIDTRQPELLNIVQFWVSKAEEVTGLPMLMQGQLGQAGQTDKVGIAQIMNNNGSTVLRRLARTFDDRITEPHIGRYYEFLLLYGPDDAKGDFYIQARGSSALVERDLQAQQLVQIVAMSLNPAYGLDPELVVREFLKSLRFNPQDLELSEEKKQEMAKRPPPEDPRVTAAKIMASSRVKQAGDQLVANAQLEKLRQDAESERAAADRKLKEVLAGIEYRMNMAELSSEERQHLETQKVLLAKVSMQLKKQEDLFVAGAMLSENERRNPAPQVAKPAAEPPQQAPRGEAYTQ